MSASPDYSHYCYRDDRHLHSFPTRRSSDLPTGHPATPPVDLLGAVAYGALTAFTRLAADAALAPDLAGRDRPQQVDGRRSEEHTSELQSQFHLVCRPLLEKKHPDERHGSRL